MDPTRDEELCHPGDLMVSLAQVEGAIWQRKGSATPEKEAGSKNSRCGRRKHSSHGRKKEEKGNLR